MGQLCDIAQLDVTYCNAWTPQVMSLSTLDFCGRELCCEGVIVGARMCEGSPAYPRDRIQRNFLNVRSLSWKSYCETDTLEHARAALAGPITVSLSPKARGLIVKSAETVARLLKTGDAIYGVNTGFGKLAKTRIAAEDLSKLQINIVRSHAAGVGTLLDENVVRLIMLLGHALSQELRAFPLRMETLFAG